MRVKKLNMFLINADTESTEEGYMSAFIASRPDLGERFPLSMPPYGKKPTKKWLKTKMEVEKLIETVPRLFTTTQQKEVREYFDLIHHVMNEINKWINTLKKPRTKTDYEANCVMFFANSGWDLDVLRGIIFPGRTEEILPIGTDSDLVQLRFGHILIRDFLRTTGFRSVKMAGMICSQAHKLDGKEVYAMKKADIPENYEDYSETKKAYILNDVKVMDEAFLIFMNQSANRIIDSMDQLPMTLTGFSRYRQQHSEEIIMIDGKKVDSSRRITAFRWKYTRPFILYQMDAYKGGYCGPNPNSQYKILKNGVCFDAVSMYPDKMGAYRHLQVTKDSVMLRTNRTFEEICSDFATATADEKEIIRYFSDTLEFFDKINDRGFQPARLDSGSGIYGYIATVECQIKGVRFDAKHNAAMMPFFSVYKSDKPVLTSDHVVVANGKVISGHFTIKLSCVDLILAMMCYDMEVLSISHMLTMGWKEMLPEQKRSMLSGYKLKEQISEVIKHPREEQREYWEQFCGFNFNQMNEMSDEEFSSFAKIYKQIIKAIPNGEYGKTVEKPIHPLTWVEKDELGNPVIYSETATQCMDRVMYYIRSQGGFYDRNGDPVPKDEKLEWPPKEWPYQIKDEPAIPEKVRCNDYAAGASITMWARWQLISIMYILFKAGHEVWYCDTDSIFTDDCQEVRKLVEEFNTWKTENWKTYYFYNRECYRSEDLGNLGQFEEDKVFDLFCTLGAKNYAYLDKKKQKFKITIAGLNTKIYEDTLNHMDGLKEMVMYDYYHPNIFIEPSACRKLVKNRNTCQIDESGEWIGPVLDHYGFAMIDINSKYHVNNLRRAEEIQDVKAGTYVNHWINKLYLSDKGFSDRPTEDTDKWEGFIPMEDRSRFVRGVDTQKGD